jgi:hypothetical protein
MTCLEVGSLPWAGSRPDRGIDSCLGSMFNSAPLGSLVLQSIRTIMEATVERETVAHVMLLWKYKPLNQDDAL